MFLMCNKCRNEGWRPYSGPTTAQGLRLCPVDKRWMKRHPGLPSVSLKELERLGIIKRG